MRTTLTAALTLSVCLLVAGPGWAGLYNTAEPPLYPLPRTFAEFQYQMGELRSIATDRPADLGGGRSPLRQHYLDQVTALTAKERAEGLTVQDQVNLAAYHIRLMEYEKAVRVLASAEAREPDNFMVLSNLATANQLAGRLDRAVVYLQQTLKVWPAVQVAFTTDQLAWYRRAERYQLALLELRQQEARAQPGGAVEHVDALFPRVRFVGPSGHYEAGVLAPEQADELPFDHILLVTQLLFWMPLDGRLSWLLAELLNAQGEVEPAVQVMNELVYTGAMSSVRELMDHRKVLLQARPVRDVFVGREGPANQEKLRWALAPRWAAGAPGVGPVMNELGWACVLDRTLAANPETGSVSPAGPSDGVVADNPAPGPRRPNSSWVPDWRMFGIGLVVGVLLTVLIGLQVRQIRQRRLQGLG